MIALAAALGTVLTVILAGLLNGILIHREVQRQSLEVMSEVTFQLIPRREEPYVDPSPETTALIERLDRELA